jgi:hypothetical protein
MLGRDHGVRSFGEEGLSLHGDGSDEARLNEAVLAPLRAAAQSDPRAFLRAAAGRWRKALLRKKYDEASHEALQLNALTVLQAVHGDVTVFPIEQQAVHGTLGSQLHQLQDTLATVERSPAFQSVVRKGGRNLTREEFDAANKHKDVVTMLSATLRHPERDRAILREVLEHAENKHLTVFLLGQAHRSGMLRLAKEHLPSDILFVWITPPQLKSGGGVLKLIGWLAVAGILVWGVINFLP